MKQARLISKVALRRAGVEESPVGPDEEVQGLPHMPVCAHATCQYIKLCYLSTSCHDRGVKALDEQITMVGSKLRVDKLSKQLLRLNVHSLTCLAMI